MVRAVNGAASAHGLDAPIGESGLPGASVLKRHGKRMGILTVRDLLTTFPRRYEDLREVVPVGRLGDLEPGTPVTIRASIDSIRVEQGFRRRVQRTIATLRDESGEVEAIWFGRPLELFVRLPAAGGGILRWGRFDPTSAATPRAATDRAVTPRASPWWRS